MVDVILESGANIADKIMGDAGILHQNEIAFDILIFQFF